jgi:hypothetical protein
MTKTIARDPLDALDAPPTIHALDPASAVLGAPSFTLRVLGSGFRTGDVIVWNGSHEPTTFVSNTELTTGVNMETAQVAIAIPVSIFRAGGQSSNEVTFLLTTVPVPSLPDGYVVLADAWLRPLIVRNAVDVIEEAIDVADERGALFLQGPKAAYRRVTLSSGALVYIADGSLGPLLTMMR